MRLILLYSGEEEGGGGKTVRKERGERERELGKKGRKDRGKKEEEKVHVVTDSLIFLFLSTLHGITSRAISMEAGGRMCQ